MNIEAMIDLIRAHGWAVAAIAPQQLGAANPDHVSEIMYQRGLSACEE